jgi:carboxyl-terminal processing protease
MNSRVRLAVLFVSAPIVLLVAIGGFLGKASARDDSYQHLRVFEDVVSLILNNYVESVNSDRIMKGAMEGLAEGLDPDSAYLAPAQVTAMMRPDSQPKGGVGLELTRQYYLRVISAREGSAAARAGLLPGDFVRAIDDKPTREMSVLFGSRLLRGAPGTKVSLTVLRGSATEPHVVELVREETPAPAMSHRQVAPGVWLVRVPVFSTNTAEQLNAEVAAVRKGGATNVLIDIRNNGEGALDDGLAAARLFVSSGLLATRETRDGKTRVEAKPGDGAIDLPVTLLVDNGTAGAAELFASALSGNGRATLVGEHTIGRAATQELVKLPDGSALWLSTARYLTPKDAVLHEKGLTPDVPVEAPDVEFGAAPSTSDPILEKAIAHLTEKKQAA